ncbi:hypothetical protein [Nocardia farcinica]|uniref:hypothetical protein n=1 Tax=Nocardia farcinica TaxID=37329 RepID=UPI002456A7A3|nr:hypothetical protein [Nocardia farcinica]
MSYGLNRAKFVHWLKVSAFECVFNNCMIRHRPVCAYSMVLGLSGLKDIFQYEFIYVTGCLSAPAPVPREQMDGLLVVRCLNEAAVLLAGEVSRKVVTAIAAPPQTRVTLR